MNMEEYRNGLVQSISRNERLGIAASLALIGGLGGWCSLTEIAGAVIVPGVLVVETNVKSVQHPTGGVVGELPVKEGDRVRAGQLLVRLEDTLTRSNYEILRKDLATNQAKRARLEAELRGATEPLAAQDLAGPQAAADEFAAAVEEANLYEARRSAREGQKKQLAEKIQQQKAQIAAYEQQVVHKREELKYIGNELASAEELWQKALMSLTKVSGLRRQSARLESELAELSAGVAQSRGAITEIEVQISQIDYNLRAEAGQDLAATEARIRELTERKVAAQDQFVKTEIRAPHDGTVYQLKVHTVGGVIPPGETIMLIVPQNELLVVDGRVRPVDVDQIAFGQSVRLRFPGLNQRSTPELAGELDNIAPDVTIDQQTGTSYYSVRIRIKEEEAAKLASVVKVIPGMPADAFVTTASRTILSYLLKPLQDQMFRAFRDT